MARRAGVKIKTKVYNRFKGVDFSTDPSKVDDSRSPWAPNMVSDMGGMPQKRWGYIELADLGETVHGIHEARFSGSSETHFLVHAGSSIYEYRGWNGRFSSATPQKVTLISNIGTERSVSAFLNNYLWIFTGSELLRYDGTSCIKATSAPYVPLTVISRDPTNGGGVSYEAVNLIGAFQKVGFLADGTSTVYHLPYTQLGGVVQVEVDGSTLVSGWTADLAAGTVTFSTAPSAPAAGAEDNVFITFIKTISGYADRIKKCRVAFVWGANGASDRIVAAGNYDYPNQDFMSAYNDPSYFPDTGYAVVGDKRSAIVGYRRMGSSLAIFKQDRGQDSTVFIRTTAQTSDGETIFPVKPCLAGVGALDRFSFGHIGDEQLVLTANGVYAITTDSLTAERIAQNRSFRIDARLTKGGILNDAWGAVCCSWDGCLLICAKGQVYGLDGKQARYYINKYGTDFVYECFYWDGLPNGIFPHVGYDYIGDRYLYFYAGNKIYLFKTEGYSIWTLNGVALSEHKQYCDEFVEDGTLKEHAIVAEWATKADDDGDPMILKTLLKQGNAVTLKPFTRSSAKVLFRTDKDAIGWQAAEGTMDIFDWEDIDFSRFTFNANDAPQEIPFRRKVRKYKRLQIIVRNDAVNEPFGVMGIVKHYVAGGFSKK